MTVIKLFMNGYINSFDVIIGGVNYSLMIDQLMFCIGFVCILIGVWIEGPPNKNVKYASIPVTAICMMQLCYDALTLQICHHTSKDVILYNYFIAWAIGIGNITGAIATWHKIPWGIYGKLSWIIVSLFSILYIIITSIICNHVFLDNTQ